MLRMPHTMTLTAGLVSVSAIAPFLCESVALAKPSFKDVDKNFWAKPYIEALAEEKIITGFPDGTFRPNAPVTRAQFASILSKAFTISPTRRYQPFQDVGFDHWAEPAIRFAFTTEFISGSSSGRFEPEKAIDRGQALVSLANGLKLKPSEPAQDTLAFFQDASDIPKYAEPGIAAAAQNQIPVNYPNVFRLNPNRTATRADISAFIFQSLVNRGRFQPLATDVLASNYIVQIARAPKAGSLIPGTLIPVTLPTTAAAANPEQQNLDAQNLESQNSKSPNPESPNSELLTSEVPNLEARTLVMTIGESLQTSFVTAEDILDGTGNVIIPKGSRIQGLFKPVQLGKRDGTQFTATAIMIGNQSYPLNASSNAIAARKRSGINLQELTGSIGTTAASTVLQSTLTGEKLNFEALLPTLLQVGGQLGQQLNREPSDEDRLIVIEPGQLGLKLNAEFDGSQ